MDKVTELLELLKSLTTGAQGFEIKEFLSQIKPFEVSLVDRAANRQRFVIVKRETDMEELTLTKAAAAAGTAKLAAVFSSLVQAGQLLEKAAIDDENGLSEVPVEFAQLLASVIAEAFPAQSASEEVAKSEGNEYTEAFNKIAEIGASLALKSELGPDDRKIVSALAEMINALGTALVPAEAVAAEEATAAEEVVSDEVEKSEEVEAEAPVAEEAPAAEEVASPAEEVVAEEAPAEEAPVEKSEEETVEVDRLAVLESTVAALAESVRSFVAAQSPKDEVAKAEEPADAGFAQLKAMIESLVQKNKELELQKSELESAPASNAIQKSAKPAKKGRVIFPLEYNNPRFDAEAVEE